MTIPNPTLTEDQRRALEQGHGAPVYVQDAVSGSRYVLITDALYHRIRALLGGDDPFDIRETYAAQDRAAEEAWNHPDDAAYDDYDAHRKGS